jgi:hypothetical protein
VLAGFSYLIVLAGFSYLRSAVAVEHPVRWALPAAS